MRTLGLLSGAVSTMLVPADRAVAHINTNYWSLSGHQLSTTSNASSNMVGFWQTLGVGKIDCINGTYDARTVAFTKRMQAEVANPPQPQTGVVNTITWNAVQAGVEPNGAARLQRLSGSNGTNGYFSYYNGSAVADLYWQGTNTGTGLWKFRPPGAGAYIEAVSARTMGSYPQPPFGC